MILPIDPTGADVAARVVTIQRSAYAVEADLMDFHGIPQLTETAEQVMARTDLTWLGAFDCDQLAGIIAWAIEDGTLDIDRLAIDPAFARKGHGRRLVQAVPTDRPSIVSTGSKNDPAITLYLGEGFAKTGETEIEAGVFMTNFWRSARP